MINVHFCPMNNTIYSGDSRGNFYIWRWFFCIFKPLYLIINLNLWFKWNLLVNPNLLLTGPLDPIQNNLIKCRILNKLQQTVKNKSKIFKINFRYKMKNIINKVFIRNIKKKIPNSYYWKFITNKKD